MPVLAKFSLANRALIALITVSIAFFGGLLLTALKQELIPSITLPQVAVITTYQGASPEVVDADVSQPIESALQGLQGLEETVTTSSDGQSVVAAKFEFGTDTVYAEQRIQQAVNRIDSQLPEDADWSVLSGSINDLPIVQLAATGADEIAVAERIKQIVVPKIRGLDGVRSADITGAREERITIAPNFEALGERGLTVQNITDTLDDAGVLVPAGTLTKGDETLTVQAGDRLESVDELRQLPIAAPDAPAAPGADAAEPSTVTLADVADITQDYAPVTSISRVNGEDALTVLITKRPSANTVEVSQAVRELLPELQAALGSDISLSIAFDQAPFIEDSIHTLVTEGALGLAFAVLVIFVFLFSVRATLITAISIPTSLLVTFIALYFFDYSLNVLTLGALTIAIGRVVDDSIVVVENIRRHLQLHPAAALRPAERARIIADAVREVGVAITASTLVTVAVFLPVVFVNDITGELFRPFALTNTIALLASLFVSLTIVPVLAYWFLAGGRLRARGGAAVTADARGAADGSGAATAAADLGAADAADAAVASPADDASPVHTEASLRRALARRAEVALPESTSRAEAARSASTSSVGARRAEAARAASTSRASTSPASTSGTTPETAEEPRNWLQRGYEPVLRAVLRHPAWVIVGALLLLAGTAAATPLLKTNFLSSAGQTTFEMRQEVDATASLAAKTAAVERMESVIREVDGIETVQVRYGMDNLRLLFGGGSNQIFWSITTADGADSVAIQDRLRADFLERNDLGDVEVGSNAAFGSNVTVRVAAPDTEVLQQAADAVVPTLAQVAGVKQVVNGLDETRPYVELDIDQAEAARRGLTEVEIGAQVLQSLQSVPTGEVMIDGSMLQLYLVDADAPPATIDELRELRIQAGAEQVPLDDLAEVTLTDGPVAITAESGEPFTELTVIADDDNVGGLGADIERALADVELPGGASTELGGSAADQRSAFHQLGLAMLAAILVVYIVMVATLKSLLQPLLLLVSVPFAATGAILLQLVADLPLGVASLIGVLMLIGIVVTNAIVLIDLVNQFRARGLTVREATFAGATRRVRPIVMTALATVLALTPMALGITGHAGFISQPMAVVVIGGLVSSTLLTLVVLPALYVLVEGRRERRAVRRAERNERRLQEAGLA